MLSNQARRVADRVMTIVAAMVAISACSGGTEPAARVRVEAVTPTTLAGVVGRDVSPVPTVMVTDGGGVPVVGELVYFSLNDPGASVGVRAVETNAAGFASAVWWTLGTRAGPQSLTARARAETVLFTATAESGPASEIGPMEGNGQVGRPGELLPNHLRAQVNDGDGFWNAVVGARVTFTVISGGGTVEPLSSVTDSAGYVEAMWTLGATVGLQEVEVRSGGAQAIFSASACAADGGCG